MISPSKTDPRRDEPDLATDYTLRLPEGLVRDLELATGEIAHLLHSAAGVFQLLWGGFSGGTIDRDDTLGMLELCHRGLKAAAEKEGVAIERFDTFLRAAMSERQQVLANRELAARRERSGGGGEEKA